MSACLIWLFLHPGWFLSCNAALGTFILILFLCLIWRNIVKYWLTICGGRQRRGETRQEINLDKDAIRAVIQGGFVMLILINLIFWFLWQHTTYPHLYFTNLIKMLKNWPFLSEADGGGCYCIFWTFTGQFYGENLVRREFVWVFSNTSHQPS